MFLQQVLHPVGQVVDAQLGGAVRFKIVGYQVAGVSHLSPSGWPPTRRGGRRKPVRQRLGCTPGRRTPPPIPTLRWPDGEADRPRLGVAVAAMRPLGRRYGYKPAGA